MGSKTRQASLHLEVQQVAAQSALALPRIAPIPREGDEWVLLEDYYYEIPVEFGGGLLVLPQGMRSDLASIRPRLVWFIVAPFEMSALAPLVHDLYYRCQGAPPPEILRGGKHLDRKGSDDLFLHIMQQEHVTAWRRSLGHGGVRVFGEPAWGASKLEVDLPMSERLMADGELEDRGWGA